MVVPLDWPQTSDVDLYGRGPVQKLQQPVPPVTSHQCTASVFCYKHRYRLAEQDGCKAGQQNQSKRSTNTQKWRNKQMLNLSIFTMPLHTFAFITHEYRTSENHRRVMGFIRITHTNTLPKCIPVWWQPCDKMSLVMSLLPLWPWMKGKIH